MVDNPVPVILEVVRILEKHGIHYVLCGSLASSVYGLPRTTADADLIASIAPEHVEILSKELATDFYADAETIKEAIQNKTSFNLVHLSSAFKIDIFIAGQDEHAAEEFKRKRKQPLDGKASSTIYMLGPEDTVLDKLRWYRMGGESSARQWADILGILRIQADRLDAGYLLEWAEILKVSDLLKKAKNEIK